jgi:hypothetical protein
LAVSLRAARRALQELLIFAMLWSIPSARSHGMNPEQEAYDALCLYTLGRGDAGFIHQHVVDAFAAQSADERTPPIALTFALVGLYLHVEKQWTGKQVQRTHMQLARQKRGMWPAFTLPGDRGSMTAVEVMRASEGAERDRAIDAWCRSVWAAFADSRAAVVALLGQFGIV